MGGPPLAYCLPPAKPDPRIIYHLLPSLHPSTQPSTHPTSMQHCLLLTQLVSSRLPDVVRGTAASALCRLLRCAPGCLQALVELGGVELVAAGAFRVPQAPCQPARPEM